MLKFLTLQKYELAKNTVGVQKKSEDPFILIMALVRIYFIKTECKLHLRGLKLSVFIEPLLLSALNITDYINQNVHMKS